ncbi:MAG: sialate O-acetylesterase [Gemmataceae bacterium]
MAKNARLALPGVLVFLLASAVQAEIKPHALISDGMVLQQKATSTVWGTAKPDEDITVVLGSVKPVTVRADKEGKWTAQIPGQKAGGPYALTISGKDEKDTVKLKDVYIGEVWICSGQSNMEMGLGGCENGEEARKKSQNEQIRLFTVPHHRANAPTTDIKAAWVECGPKTVGGFSGVAYFFGRDLQKALGVPVGLIHTSVGGTAAEEWTSKKVLESDPAFKSLAPGGSKLYNGMIAPLLPFAVKGAIWYQGESNAGSFERVQQYEKLFAALIENWRHDWNQPEMPFLFVQLAPFMKKETEPTDTPWARMREVQRLTSLNPKLAPIAMAVITDSGDEKDIHPKKKEPAGVRLALAARAIAYNEKDLEYSGPQYKSMQIQDGKAVLSFSHDKGGLEAQDGKLTGFTIAGEDGNFINADATIEGDKAVVSSPKIVRPAAVRYGWANYPEGNLWNKAGLPASPFRTDDWPPVAKKK